MTLEFDEHGYVIAQDEPIDVTKELVRVQLSRLSGRRSQLWASAEELWTVIRQASVPVVEIWIDGSFVSLTLEPNDVDIVIFIDGDYLNSHRVVLDDVAEAIPYLDIKWRPLFVEDKALTKAINELERLKWFWLFGTDRAGVPKGVLRLIDF